MSESDLRIRLLIAYVFLFAVVVITAYLQSLYHFNTYLALGICLADTIIAAIIFLGHENN